MRTYGTLARGADGNMWLAQTYSPQSGDAQPYPAPTIVRITPALESTEFPVGAPSPSNSQVLSALVLGPDHSIWFGTNSDLGRIDADGNIQTFPRTGGGPGAAPVAADGAAVYFLTGVNFRKMVRVTVDGSQTLIGTVPTSIRVSRGVTVASGGYVWQLAQNQFTGLVAKYVKSGALYRFGPTGARTTYRLSGRELISYLTPGPRGRLWALTSGYSVADARLVAIDENGKIKTQRRYAAYGGNTKARQPENSIFPTGLAADSRTLWVFTNRNSRRSKYGLQRLRVK